MGKNTKSEIAYNFIKNQIVIFHYQPGEKINIREIARQIGVSDIPVREALKRLESEGFVVFKNNSGASVAPFDIENFIQVCKVRFELEVFATKLAAENITSEEINVLEDLILKMDECIANNDEKTFGLYNSKFHMEVYKASHIQVLVELIENLISRSMYTRSIFNLVPDRFIDANIEHKEILKALMQRDADKAAEIIRYQKEHSIKRVIPILKTMNVLHI